MALYAAGTKVSVSSSQAEIRNVLARYGAEGFMFGEDNEKALVGFRAHGRNVRFVVPMPTDDELRLTPGRIRRTAAQITTARAAEERRRWRALALAIKAKLEVVASGIATFEEEFLAHVVLPSGQTIGDHVTPAIAEAYERGVMPSTLLQIGS